VTWVRIDDHFDEHPKLAQAGTVCWGVWLAGIAYSNRNLTDGFIPWSVARSLGSWEMLDLEPDEDDPDSRLRIWTVGRMCGMAGEDINTEWIIERLVGVGLWDQVAGGFRIHDFDDYQPTKDEVLATREQKAEAGRKGGQRTQAHRRTAAKAPAQADAQAPARPRAQAEPQAESKPVPVPVPVPEVLSNVLSTGADLDFIEPSQFFEERTKRKASQKVRDWLEDLHARFSRRELLAAMKAVPSPKESDWLKKVDEYLERAA
jgi:hypothetical protein